MHMKKTASFAVILTVALAAARFSAGPPAYSPAVDGAKKAERTQGAALVYRYALVPNKTNRRISIV